MADSLNNYRQNATAASSVAFPTSGPMLLHPPQSAKLPYQPFRRISLPTAPTMLHRQSVVSVASFDSLPEEGPPLVSSSSLAPPTPASPKKPKLYKRPMSSDGRRNASRRRESKPIDEAKVTRRRQVIHEFYATEKTYVEGLELIYSHFLSPIIESLNTNHPILDRAQLTSVFSNFIDIWNFHHSFFSALSLLLVSPSTNTLLPIPPPISSLLTAHFPYLSLYTPFVTSFPEIISSSTALLSQTSPTYNAYFADFIFRQEKDPRCGKLGIRDFLLTIVQRCPRYLLLLKDLLVCTEYENPEHVQLTTVFNLVSKITHSLNTSLHAHAQTLSLLALQRSTPTLPFQFIAPGRTLIRRGPLHILEQRAPHARPREILLFSDCILWLASEDVLSREREWGVWEWGGPLGIRARSKSDAAHSSPIQTPVSSSPPGARSAFPALRARRQPSVLPSPIGSPMNSSSGAGEEKWVYKGHLKLVDVDVVINPSSRASWFRDKVRNNARTVLENEEESFDEDMRLEILSPGESFAVYAATREERDSWAADIRSARSALLSTLNATNPNTTLTSSTSTTHLRKTLQALPYAPSLNQPPSPSSPTTSGWRKRSSFRGDKDKDNKDNKSQKENKDQKKVPRAKVEHWFPPIWVPDGKTESCMQCSRPFGWRRRRHHCRLCGRCVCAQCSNRTFFIADPNAPASSSTPARACDACYETVFPVISDDPNDLAYSNTSTFRCRDLGSSALRPSQSHVAESDSGGSLTGLPAWSSMPVLASAAPGPDALMAIDIGSGLTNGIGGGIQKRPVLSRIDSAVVVEGLDSDRRESGGSGYERVRIKSNSRPRSYYDILEDFEDMTRKADADANGVGPPSVEDITSEGDEDDSDEREPMGIELVFGGRKEDTARRNKRFSLPAVSLQTTAVTARSGGALAEERGGRGGGGAKGKRFSLVLGGRNVRSFTESGGEGKEVGKDELGRGVAAGKLADLLKRRTP